jgi:hypothetical protein
MHRELIDSCDGLKDIGTEAETNLFLLERNLCGGAELSLPRQLLMQLG